MRALHSVEEQIYGPKSTLPIKAKVFLCIRHNTVRWDLEEDKITYGFIAEKTGEAREKIVPAVKRLEEEGMILVRRTKDGKQSLSNLMGLNPDFFGIILEKKCRPKFSVVEGGKQEKLPTPSAQNDTNFESKSVPESAPPPVPESAPQLELKLSELLEKIARNNSLNNHKNLKERKNTEELKAQLMGNERQNPSRELQQQWLRETDGAYDFSAWFQKRASQ